MKKENRHTFYGFTVAEILISLAIVMIVATAMVPVIGTNKVKHPENHMDHGIAVCYYDQDGQLNYEYRENKADGVSRVGAAEGNYCVFTVPQAANYLEIIAIGAGGSSTSNDFSMQLVPGANSGNGSLQIDDHFQEDIDASASVDSSLPQKIRDAMDEWARRNQAEVYAEYTNVVSPIGAPGPGKCRAQYANGACSAVSPARGGDGPNGSWYTAHTGNSSDYTSGCWWYQHGRGGNSGTGLRLDRARLPLSGSSMVKLEKNISNVGVSVIGGVSGSNSFNLSASGNGGEPNWAGSRYTNGTSSNQNSQCTSTGSINPCAGAATVSANQGYAGGVEVPQTRECKEDKVQATEGQIHYLGENGGNAWNGGAYNWLYQDPAVNVTFARRGAYGSEVSQVYENIRGILHLYPAQNNNVDGSTFSVVQRTDGTQLVRAKSGADNGGAAATMTMNQVGLTEQIPSDITKESVPENESNFKYLGKLTNSGYRLPILNCIENGNCPGFAGTGTYLFVRNTERLEFLTLTNRQNAASYTKYFGADEEYRSANEECLNLDNIRSYGNGMDWAMVCNGRVKSGSSGAIVIIW